MNKEKIIKILFISIIVIINIVLIVALITSISTYITKITNGEIEQIDEETSSDEEENTGEINISDNLKKFLLRIGFKFHFKISSFDNCIKSTSLRHNYLCQNLNLRIETRHAHIITF